MKKTPSFTAFCRALRGYRNCPRYDGLSPAHWYYGRRQRTDAVAFPAAYERIPDATMALHEARRGKKGRKLQSCANKSSCHRAPLEPGQAVIAQHMLTRRWDQHATILESRSNGSSYVVKINGRSYLRNRRFLWPSPGPADPVKLEDTPVAPREPEKVRETGATTRRYLKRDCKRRMSIEANKPKRKRRF